MAAAFFLQANLSYYTGSEKVLKRVGKGKRVGPIILAFAGVRCISELRGVPDAAHQLQSCPSGFYTRKKSGSPRVSPRRVADQADTQVGGAHVTRARGMILQAEGFAGGFGLIYAVWRGIKICNRRLIPVDLLPSIWVVCNH